MKKLSLFLLFFTFSNITIADDKLFIVKKNSVVDVKSGLEWYKLNKTTNFSFDEIRKDYNSPGNRFDKDEGWRHATKAEFRSLVNRWFKFDPRYRGLGLLKVPRGKAKLVEKFIDSFGDTGAVREGTIYKYYKLTGKASSIGMLAFSRNYLGINLITFANVSDMQWQNKQGIDTDAEDFINMKFAQTKGVKTYKFKSELYGHWLVKRISESTLTAPQIKSTTIPFPTMVLIPSGQYKMGCSDGDKSCLNFEKPAHYVRLKEFFMSTTEVTFKQYDFYCDKTPSCKKPDDNGWGRDNRPVINVSYLDAKKYIKWLNSKTNKKFRLPTESEWEYAARAGSNTLYYWGNDANKQYANGAQKKAFEKLGIPWDKSWQEWPKDGYIHSTAPVATYSPNKWGLYDMVGNVHEWCEDKWYKSHHGAPNNGHARKRGKLPVLRGGSWDSPAFFLRLSMRGNSPANTRSKSAGFRLALD